jgi:hypothetical protein
MLGISARHVVQLNGTAYAGDITGVTWHECPVRERETRGGNGRGLRAAVFRALAPHEEPYLKNANLLQLTHAVNVPASELAPDDPYVAVDGLSNK